MSANAAGGLPQPRRAFALLGITLAIMLASLDSSIVNIALPEISKSLSVAPASIIWAVLAYQVVISVSLFPLAFVGDRVGHRLVYSAGVVVFIASSTACAFSPNLTWLVASRAVQGLGAAGIMSVNMALIRFIMPPALLGRGIARNTLTVGLSLTAGPTIASAILSVASWQWLFLVNIPIGIIAFVLARTALPETPRITTRAFDVGGAALTALTLGVLIVAIDGVGRGDPPLFLVGEFITGIVLVTILLNHQSRQSVPILPLDLLRIPLIGLSGASAILAFIVQGMSFVTLPFYFHDVQGFSQVMVGFAMTPWPAAMVIASPIAGRLSERFNPGLLGLFGLMLVCVGLILVWLIPQHASWGNIAWRMFICGYGMGTFQVPNSRAIIENAPAHRSGGASAIQASGRLYGQAIGAALGAACFGLLQSRGAEVAPIIAAGFAVIGCMVSSLRIRH
jgi:DHA2 family multidrug resistance protein-like MFS transporter